MKDMIWDNFGVCLSQTTFGCTKLLPLAHLLLNLHLQHLLELLLDLLLDLHLQHLLLLHPKRLLLLLRLRAATKGL